MGLFLPNLTPQCLYFISPLVLNLQSHIHADLSTFHNVIRHVIVNFFLIQFYITRQYLLQPFLPHMGSSPIFQTIWDHLQSSGIILDYLFTIFYYHLRLFETILSYLGPSHFSAHLGPSHSNWDHLTPSGTNSDHSVYLLKAVLIAT